LKIPFAHPKKRKGLGPQSKVALKKKVCTLSSGAFTAATRVQRAQVIATHLTRVCSQHTTFCMRVLRMHRDAHLLVTLTTLLRCAVQGLLIRRALSLSASCGTFSFMLSILWSIFSPLGTLFLSAFVIYVLAVFALRLCNHADLFLLSWGIVQGVSWGLFLYKLVLFCISIFSHPSYS
jgi:hypothetical protein